MLSKCRKYSTRNDPTFQHRYEDLSIDNQMPFASKKKRLSVTPSTSDLSSLNQEEPVSLLAYKSDVSISQKEVSLNELQPVDLVTCTTGVQCYLWTFITRFWDINELQFYSQDLEKSKQKVGFHERSKIAPFPSDLNILIKILNFERFIQTT